VKIRVPHGYDFGRGREAVGRDLLNPHAWDAARQTDAAFALPTTRAELERRADDEELRSRARAIAEIARERGVSTLCSHGVGSGLLELNLLRELPNVRLVCTDFAPQTVARLGELVPAATFVLRNLTDPNPPGADLDLMHRLDAELSDDDWRLVFEMLTRPVLFVPNVLLGPFGVLRELARWGLHPRRLTRAGYFRNEPALRSLWTATHSDVPVRIGGARGFLLSPRAT